MSERTVIESQIESPLEIVCRALCRYRDDWKDELPTKVLPRNGEYQRWDQTTMYKVKTTWFSGVVAHIDFAVTEGLIFDESVEDEAIDFVEYGISQSFLNRGLTTAEDVEEANRVIDLVLADLDPASKYVQSEEAVA